MRINCAVFCFTNFCNRFCGLLFTAFQSVVCIEEFHFHLPFFPGDFISF